ncbi:cyclic nucleotide-binding domain-containing protein [Egbenema bharatensis]|uniref:cyclic nucleotide-binding domain-containing protein n=1 Tax=Egbenema bharatensis TaxID=3463334 RepID=UPI003A879FA2
MTTVNIATTSEEKQQIYRFRYQVYVEEMRKKPKAANHTARILTDPLDETSILLYVTHADEIIATLRRNFLDASKLPETIQEKLSIADFTHPKHQLSISTRLMIAPQWRRSVMVGAIVAEAYRQGRERDLQFDFVHCAPWLVPFYENLGYRRYTDHFLDSDTGLQIPMILVMEDVEHLRTVRSPFYRLARKQKNTPLARDWFLEHFPQQQRFFNHCTHSIEEIWQFWRPQFQSPGQTAPIFEGIGDDTVAQLLKGSTVHPVKAGDTILQIGDISNALFLLLEGAIEVNYLAGTSCISTELKPFQTFGEAALCTTLPSPEQVVAKTNAHLLIIPKPTIMKVMKTSPSTMCQFFLNVSRSLGDKYVPNVETFDLAASLAVKAA